MAEGCCVIVYNSTGIRMTTLPEEYLELYRRLRQLLREGDVLAAQELVDVMDHKGVE